VDARPRSFVSRRLWAALLAYHALVVGGGALAVLGWVRAETPWVFGGLALLALGIGIQVAVLGWSTRIIRRAARGPPVSPPAAAVEASSARRRGSGFCPSCGWKGILETSNCPRCGRPSVRLTDGRGP